MKHQHHGNALRRAAHAAILASLALPGLAAAGEAGPTAEELQRREREELRQREVEELRLQREEATARREMEQRERTQRQALRAQEESIERLQERMADARERLEESSREYARLSSELGRSAYAGTVVNAPPRALLGISVDTSERRDGALVAQVSPGGAAEEAGVRRGDVITSLDGQDLTKEKSPGRALVDKLQQIKPDTKVKMGLLRDGKKINLEVTTREAPRVDRFALRSPPNIRVEPFRGEMLQLDILGNGVAGMEFATLSDRLGDYFGVDDGVLVVRAGANNPYSLQDGDVILSIDGRKPANAQHVGRILRSYQPGEKVKLRVQRDRKAIDLDATVPSGRGAGGP